MLLGFSLFLSRHLTSFFQDYKPTCMHTPAVHCSKAGFPELLVHLLAATAEYHSKAPPFISQSKITIPCCQETSLKLTAHVLQSHTETYYMTFAVIIHLDSSSSFNHFTYNCTKLVYFADLSQGYTYM